MKETIKTMIIMYAAAMLSVSGLLLYSCSEAETDGNTEQAQDDEQNGDVNDDSVISELVGEWTFESGTFALITSNGSDDFESPIAGKESEIIVENETYGYNFHDFFLVEIVGTEFGAEAVIPQQVGVGMNPDAEDATIMEVKQGTISELTSGQIEVEFSITGLEEIQGETIETEFVVEGTAKRK